MNQRGSAVTVLLVSLPLLVACMAVCCATVLLLQDQQKSLQICRQGLLQAQQNMLDTAQILFDLNSQAALLRARRLAAEAMVLESAGNPITTPPAVANLEAVVAQQEKFALAQKALIQKANWQAKLNIYQVKGKLQSAINRKDSNFTDHKMIPELDLIATPKSSLTPNYRPNPEFTKTQVMRIHWSTKLTASLQPWLNKELENAGATQDLQGQCAVTAEKKGEGKWISRLEKDKSSSNSFLSLF
jgi:hypothetical protein